MSTLKSTYGTCLSLKLMAGHFDTGCVHYLSVLALFTIKKLGTFHSFCGSSTLVVSTRHELPVRIAAADQCQDGLDNSSLLHEFGLF